MTELTLIRHGETDWNIAHRIQGHLDIPLNCTGLAQAEALSERLRDVDIDVLMSSDLQRALQTVAPISRWHNLPVTREAGLRERHLGVLQGKTPEEAMNAAPAALQVWRSRSVCADLEQGESLAAFAQRVVETLSELASRYRDKRIVAVTHGGVVDIAYRHANNMSLETERTFPIHNASINKLRVTENGFEVLSWSDVSHLPDESAMDEF
jgi:probable phosphoglycerate mutase